VAFAQGDGARTYWHNLAGANAVNFWYVNASGNANPIDPAHVVLPESDFDANLAFLGFHKQLPLFGRSARASVLLPIGNIDLDTTVAGSDRGGSASGFGDPGLQLAVNVFGAPAIRSLADFVRFEPTFTLDLLGTVNFPIGQYDDDKTVNLGQNRWYGRIGMPMVYTFAPWIPWVPGKRTTFELLPAVWFFSDNDDFHNPASGEQAKLSNDPMLQFEVHATRDLTESFWVSADLLWLHGAGSDLDGRLSNVVSDKNLDRLAIGPTLSFQLTEGFILGASYMATVNDSGSNKFNGSEFRLALTYGWHSLVEGMKRIEAAHD